MPVHGAYNVPDTGVPPFTGKGTVQVVCQGCSIEKSLPGEGGSDPTSCIFIGDNFRAQVDTLVANIRARTRDKLLDLPLLLCAERTFSSPF